MPTTDSQQFGIWGEQAAIRHLVTKGYRILETNWLLGIGKNPERQLGGKIELDIIAYDGPTLVFIEVKTRKNEFFGHPETAVTRSKQKNIFRAADTYVRQNQLNVNVRFDIIAVVGTSPDNFTITHIPNAFYPTLYRR